MESATVLFILYGCMKRDQCEGTAVTQSHETYHDYVTVEMKSSDFGSMLSVDGTSWCM
jgi:hypothetical protein